MFKVLVFGIGVLLTACSLKSDNPESTLHLNLEYAVTDLEQAQGLMWRNNLPGNGGMMFVFKNDGQHCFWMKNTLIPLSIGFIDSSGKLTQIEDMEPQTETEHCPRYNIRYALEVNQGWFGQNQVSVGTQILKPNQLKKRHKDEFRWRM